MATLLASAIAAGPAASLTTGDVLKLDTKHRSGFFIGAIDMASHLFAVDGRKDKAQCVLDWYFNNEPETAVREVHSFFESHADQDAVAVLHVLMNRKCGN